MGEFRKRPTVEEMDVDVLVGPKKVENRKGRNLNDVLRVIVWDMKEANRWPSTRHAARHLGLKQQTLSTLMDTSRTGTTVDTLSAMCAALRESPIALFSRYEEYDAERRPGFLEDMVFDRFRALLDRGQASRLLRVLEVVRDAGALDAGLELLERLLPSALPSLKVASQKGPKSE